MMGLKPDNLHRTAVGGVESVEFELEARDCDSPVVCESDQIQSVEKAFNRSGEYVGHEVLLNSEDPNLMRGMDEARINCEDGSRTTGLVEYHKFADGQTLIVIRDRTHE